jgi:hypothetical protein
MFIQQIHFHASFFNGALDRLHDHVLSARCQNQRNGFALFQNTKAVALQAGRLSRDRARVGHDLIDRLRRLGVRGKTGRRIDILLSAIRAATER